MKKLIIIDDSVEQVKILMDALEDISLEIIHIKDISDIDKVVEEIMDSDIVLCDYHFAGNSRSGIDVLNRLAKEDYDGKAYLLTGDLMIDRTECKHEIISKMSLFTTGIDKIYKDLGV